jgi:transposase InsO family protein
VDLAASDSAAGLSSTSAAIGERLSRPLTVAEAVEPVITRLREYHASRARAPDIVRRGSCHQRDQRHEEQLSRRHAAEAGRRLIDLGWVWARIADSFHVASRTLRSWCLACLDRMRSARPLGRPVARSAREKRNDVIHFLDEHGPQVGMPTLRTCFPALTRAELDEILKRYRLVWRERNRQPLRVLNWTTPGRVWAIDFTEPPTPIDGHFGCLLAVRDLASGMPLLWQPVGAATGATTAAMLDGLFATHGPPLVLKSDNGSPFTGTAVADLLKANRVMHLLSPPAWPRFNGSIEAGIHSLKDRTVAQAARTGHPGCWTSDDVAAARHEAAVSPRPHGTSPAASWLARTAISEVERASFHAAVEHQVACGTTDERLTSQGEVARRAIRLTLEERGYLQYRRRRILPPINARIAASNM